MDMRMPMMDGYHGLYAAKHQGRNRVSAFLDWPLSLKLGS
jgi:hypothetical protein